MRAVARRLGMPASSLYRFYADHAELMTELRVGAYKGLCDQLEAALDAADPNDSRKQFRALARSFRAWAVRNLDEFGLLYNSPAPDEEPWEPPVYAGRARAASIVGAVLARAVREGQLVPAKPSPGILPDTPAWVDDRGNELDAAVVQITLSSWAALIGQISIEQRRVTMISDPAAHYEHYVSAVMIAMGFVKPPTDR